MTREQELERGVRAEKLLKDELLQEGFAAVRQAIHERIESAPIRDVEGLLQLKLMLKLLRDVRANLEQAVQNGTLAAHELKLEQERKKGLFR